MDCFLLPCSICGKMCLSSAKSYEAQDKSPLFKQSTITMFIIRVVKGWFLWMIVGCYLGRVTNLLALLWLIYGPSLRATMWYTVLHCVTLWCTVVHCDVLLFTTVHCGSLCCTLVHCGSLCTLWYTVYTVVQHQPYICFTSPLQLAFCILFYQIVLAIQHSLQI